MRRNTGTNEDAGHDMKRFFLSMRWIALTAVAVLFAASNSKAQTFVPVPFVTAIAGEATGSGNTLCSSASDIPDAGGNHFGDGCLPTQATIANMYDVKVDTEGNIYISEGNVTLPSGVVSGNDIRVIYKGGVVLTAVLKAANIAIPNFNPVPGRIYTLAGGLNGTISAYKSVYYCDNLAPGPLVALDSLGDGCPAAQTRMAPRGLSIDQYGNIYLVNVTTKYGTRIIYAGGAQVAALITLLNPTVTTPQVGYIYQLGFNGATGAEGDGGIATNAGTIAPRYMAVDNAGNVYVADGTNGSTTVDDSGLNVRMINATTGIVTTVAGETTCGLVPYNAAVGCAPYGYGYSGDGGPATEPAGQPQVMMDYPTNIFFDQYNNMFIGDNANHRLRVVYRGGVLAPLKNQGVTPQVGYIYTYAGGSATSPPVGLGTVGTSTVDGTAAQNIAFNSLNGAGIDKNGNIYILDSGTRQMWKIDPISGIGYIIAGGPTDTTAPLPGTFCVGTSGPVSLDNNGDGCPGTSAFIADVGSISFDSQGNFYTVNTTAVTTANEVVQEFSYQNQYPATPVGTAKTQYVAFSEFAAAPGTTLTGRTFSLQGAPDTEYSDAGGTSCSPTQTVAFKTLCVVKVSFDPTHPGNRPGLLTLNSAAGVAGTLALEGIGEASDIAIDAGTVSTLGTGLTPSGIAADLQGNVYISDSKGGQVLKGPATGATAPAPLVTGLKNPSQIAIDNSGNLYIADTGNNRVLITTSAGTTIASVGAGLSGPKGVAVDSLGNLFVADTGNNRIVSLTAEGYQLTVPVMSLTPTTPTLSAPTQLGFDPSGNLYVLDSGNARILEENLSTGTTGPVTLDTTVTPTAFAIDSAGNFYITDTSNSLSTPSVLVYYAGATPGFSLLSGLVTPVGMSIDADANIYVADTGMIGAIGLRRSLGNVVFPITAPGSKSQADLTLNNVGNEPLTFTAPLYTVSNPLFSLAPATTNGCGAGISYALGGTCNFTATFSPAVAGSDTATANFVTNAANTTTASAVLNGTSSVILNATTLALTVAGTAYSQPVTLTAVATCGTGAPTVGTLTLTVDGKTVEPPSPIGNGSVTFVLPLPFGTHQFTVTYSGGGSCASATSAISAVVTPAFTTTNLTITPRPVAGLANLTFTSTVSVVNQTAVGQTGTLNIYQGATTGTPICSGNISINNSVPYTVSCTLPTLNFASNCFTAVYSGSSNGNFNGSQSATVCSSTSDFIVSPTLSAFTIPQGGVGTLAVNIYSVYGSSGVVTPGCTGLPANSVCAFSLNTVFVTPGTSSAPYTPLTVQLYTDVPSTLASNDHAGRGGEIALACGLPLGLGLLLVRKRRGVRALAMIVLGASMIAGMSGCSSQKSTQTFSGLVTPAGTYTITLTFTGSSGLTSTHTVPATFTVLPAPTVF